MDNELNVTLRFTQGSSDKIYKASLERLEKDADNCGWVVNFAYGRFGKALKAGTKTAKPLSYEKALKAYDKLIEGKVAKGYVCIGTTGRDFKVVTNAKATGWLPQLLNRVYNKDLISVFADFAPEVYVQIKHDGERRGIIVSPEGIVPANRRGLETTVEPAVMDSLEKLVGGTSLRCIIDTEDMGDHLVIFDVTLPPPYGAELGFTDRSDLLHVFWKKLQNLGITNILVDLPQKMLNYTSLVAFIEKARYNKEEGVVIRDGQGLYIPGKPNSGGPTLKIKFVESATCIVESVHPTKRSIGLGMYPQGTHQVGNCTIPPNYDIPEVGDLVEIEYLYAYREGSLYQPIYRGVRTDLNPEAAGEVQLKYKKD